jgi:hypothetical protein
MRIFSTMLFSIVAVVVSGSMAFARDLTHREPNWKCRWDGTAPFCDGDCAAGEVFSGSAPNRVRASAEVTPEGAQLFGASCATGNKAWCCTYSCPEGFRLVEESGISRGRSCERVESSGAGGALSTQTDVETKLRKGPVEAPGPVDETEPSNGPIKMPGPIEGTKVEEGPIEKPDDSFVTKRKTAPITE